MRSLLNNYTTSCDDHEVDDGEADDTTGRDDTLRVMTAELMTLRDDNLRLMTTAWMTLREAVITKCHRQSRHQLCCHHSKSVISSAVEHKKALRRGLFLSLLLEIIFLHVLLLL